MHDFGGNLEEISGKLKVYHAAKTLFLKIEGWNINIVDGNPLITFVKENLK